MSLYRKYRPKHFADVYGQEHIVTTLENAIKRDRLVHAYLFAGSRGTGKTSVARILARHLMLKGIEDEVIKKQIEKGVEEGSLIDLLEIDAASNRGIDHVRDLIEKIQFSPVVAGAKVYIIDEVHMLTKESFNALLKTLEEPPEYAYFILATTEFNKIPETITSRCQCFPFKHVSESNIVRRLQYIADQEHITVEREALRAIAHVSEGGMRDAISLLDQMRSLDNITHEDVKVRLGTSGHEYTEQALAAIAQNDREGVLTIVASAEEAGVPLDVFTKQLLKSLRESLHSAIEKKEQTNELLRMMDVLLNAIRDIRMSPVPGLVLEGALLSLCTDNGTTPAPAPAAPKVTVTATPTPKVVEAPADEPKVEVAAIADAIVHAPDLTLETVQRAWPDVVNQTTPASVKMSLKNGQVAALNDNKIEVRFASAFHKDKVADTDASRTIEDVLKKMFKTQLKIECTVEGGTRPIEKVPEQPQDELVNLADAAAEIF